MHGHETGLNAALPVLFVTGTDTGIGKTVLSLLLLKTLLQRGYDPFYCKLVQTGCADPYDSESDARFIYAHTQQWQNRDCAEAVSWCFPNPKAPLYAARDAGVVLSRVALCARIAELHARHACLLVEGAGGLCVPFTDDTLCVDLIQACAARPILAARAGLGTINHSLLSLHCLEQHQITPAGLFFMAETDSESENAADTRENMEAVAAFSASSVTGFIPRLNSFDAVPDTVLQPLHALLAELERSCSSESGRPQTVRS